MKEKTRLRSVVDKIFGGLNLSWPIVLLYAVGAAVLTTVFLLFPVFKGTSFARMGETLEAWVLFAVIIIANAKSPLDSALKTFVFFLISQPLIYLFQVPFSWQGWGLFQYYRYWFILTLLTFPAAFIGWYIKKRNWISLLILLPVLALLAYICEGGIKNVIYQFPNMLVMVVFCILQIVLYLYAFTDNIAQKIVGALVPLALVAYLMFAPKNAEFSASRFLPDNPVLSEEATVAVDDTKVAEISVSGTGENSTVMVRAHSYGSTAFTIKDGGKEYKYDINIYEDNTGTSQIDITVR